MNPEIKAVLGIDPGVNGGATILLRDGSVYRTEPFRPKMTHPEFVALLGTFFANLALVNGLIPGVQTEKVGYIRGDGGQGAFTFGQVDGLIRASIISAKFRINDVLPMMWQSKLCCPSGGDKNVTKKKAQELWPYEKWTHATADSALIAEWLRRRNCGV
jgi:hypothetical protein